MNEQNGVEGHGVATVYGPDGEIKQQVAFKNLITDTGDLVYATRGVGTGASVATGMRLGTGATAPAKSGAGAAIVTYVSASNVAFDGGFPALSDKGVGAGHRIAHQSTWAAGVATATGLAEVVITNETPLTNVAGTAANTIARALLSPTVDKGADDTLEVTWNHDFLGA
jgi:hypothetical protein